MAELLIPAPAELKYGPEAEAFTFDASTPITFSGDSLFAAQQLQSAIDLATGLRLPLRTTPAAEGVTLTLSNAEQHAEGYSLQVRPNAITVTAASGRGLFYGVQTLKQLVRVHGARIPAMSVRDWPVLAHRGVMLDVSRGKVPRLSTLCQLVDQLAACKYNQLQLYIEHTFAFASH